MNRLRLFAAAIVFCSTSSAQNFPTRPVTIVVPFSAGGPTDTIARIMAERMAKSLAQTGGGGNGTGAGGKNAVGRGGCAGPGGHLGGIGHTRPPRIQCAADHPGYDPPRGTG